MNVYVFGNPNVPEDQGAIEAAERLTSASPGVSFVFVQPNEDAPFADERHVVILDTVKGLDQVTVIEDEDLDNFALSPRGSVHDFDLAFQLKYLKKIGRLGRVTVVGLPSEGDVDYFRIRSILRKLVAQDIHGS